MVGQPSDHYIELCRNADRWFPLSGCHHLQHESGTSTCESEYHLNILNILWIRPRIQRCANSHRPPTMNFCKIYADVNRNSICRIRSKPAASGHVSENTSWMYRNNAMRCWYSVNTALNTMIAWNYSIRCSQMKDYAAYSMRSHRNSQSKITSAWAEMRNFTQQISYKYLFLVIFFIRTANRMTFQLTIENIMQIPLIGHRKEVSSPKWIPLFCSISIRGRALVNDYARTLRLATTFRFYFPGSGSHLGLTVILNANTDDYHCSSTNSAGFKILLHNPIETPKIADYGISITPGYETRIIVTPNLFDTSDALRRVPRNVRQCVFENEYQLSYYR